MRSKAYQEIKQQAPAKTADIATAVAFLKEHTRPGFDETVEVHAHLGVNAEKSDQAVRGTATLPAGLPRKPRVVVFTPDAAQQAAARDAGATNAGGEELVATIVKEGILDADATIATPAMMQAVAKAAKILGPKGLMPSPKAGTVSDDPVKTIQELLGGRLSFKMDQHGNVHAGIAKISWEQEKITANIEAFLEAVRQARPPTAKGEFLRSVSVKTTMSPSIRISG
jgi:large subunit ribosomal protein L1